MEDPHRMLHDIIEWAREDARVSAVVQTGSRGRDLNVDVLSDLDIELVGDDQALATDDTWYHALGDVLVCLSLPNDGMPSRLVVFRQGRKVDFFLRPPAWISGQVEHGLCGLYDDGYVVHLDKSGALSALPAPTMPSYSDRPVERTLPGADEFRQVTDEFWFEATQVATFIVRDDFWVTKYRENTMHECLLTMLEWQAWTAPRPPSSTGHIGKGIRSWLDERQLQLARDSFSNADPGDTWVAIAASMRLFAETSATVAGRLGYPDRPHLVDDVSRLHRHVQEIAGSHEVPARDERASEVGRTPSA